MKFVKRIKLSDEGKDFIRKLTIKNKKNRLGANGVEEIKKHPWFGDLDWNDILNKNC